MDHQLVVRQEGHILHDIGEGHRGYRHSLHEGHHHGHGHCQRKLHHGGHGKVKKHHHEHEHHGRRHGHFKIHREGGDNGEHGRMDRHHCHHHREEKHHGFRLRGLKMKKGHKQCCRAAARHHPYNQSDRVSTEIVSAVQELSIQEI